MGEWRSNGRTAPRSGESGLPPPLARELGCDEDVVRMSDFWLPQRLPLALHSPT